MIIRWHYAWYCDGQLANEKKKMIRLLMYKMGPDQQKKSLIQFKVKANRDYLCFSNTV